MKDAITYLAAIGGATALTFCLATQVSALDTDIYLNASASATAQEVHTSVELKSEASSSKSSNGDDESLEKAEAQDSGDKTYERSAGSSSWNRLWAYFGAEENASATTTVRTNLWKELTDLLDRHVFIAATSSSVISTEGQNTLANVRVEEVGAKRVIITWSPSVFQNLSVYYSTTTPVAITNTTTHVSPWKFWKRSEVTLKGLTPDTTYFYKVVAGTDSGTTTTIEASFRTTQK